MACLGLRGCPSESGMYPSGEWLFFFLLRYGFMYFTSGLSEKSILTSGSQGLSHRKFSGNSATAERLYKKLHFSLWAKAVNGLKFKKLIFLPLTCSETIWLRRWFSHAATT